MNLKVVLPSNILFECTVSKVIFDGKDGSFCFLPRHIDFVSVLVPSILTFQSQDEGEQYLVHDEGIIVKKENDVVVAVKHGLIANSLGSLKGRLEKEFQDIENQEQKTKKLLVDLEVDFIKRFLEIKKYV